MKSKSKLKDTVVSTTNWILRVLDFICALLEIHFVKVVAICIMALCCSMVNPPHLLVVVIMMLSLMLSLSALQVSFSFIGPFLGLLFLAKMLYQTQLFPEFEIKINCTVYNSTIEKALQATIRDVSWWGFERFESDNTLFSHYKGYTMVFIILTLQTVVRMRQKMSRIDRGMSTDVPRVLFPSITRKHADQSLKHCLKFLLNYGFYKFGIEITLSFCVFVIGFRLDIFSVLYAVWVFILFLPTRTTLSVLWPFFTSTLILSILWQYLLAMGFSENSCFPYHWFKHREVTVWLFFPHWHFKTDTDKTLVDFVLLILVQRQQAVFDVEKKYGDNYNGGSNREVYKYFDRKDFINPVPDHTCGIRSWLDVMKFIFMTCFFRITLAFLFWNGASNVNFLSLGYLVGAFVFLWVDYDLCLWPVQKIIKWWNSLLAYTVLVVFLKTLLLFVGCVYGDYLRREMNWVMELLRTYCTTIEPNEKISFLWDIVCFCCIIFQRRYVKSCYFQHEVNDVLAIYRLQVKGAKFVDDLHELRLIEFQDRERKTLQEIKKNMHRIKAWQKRMQGRHYDEPTDHANAIYMGDYYMFEDRDRVSGDSDESSSSDEILEKKKKETGKITMSQLLETVFKKSDESQKKISVDKSKTQVLNKELVSKIKSISSLLHSESKKLKKGRVHLFLDNIMVILIRFLNKYSKDYRSVQIEMQRERKLQRAQQAEDAGVANASQFGKEDDDDEEDEEEQELNPRTIKSQKLFVELFRALVMLVMSKTELICFVIIFFHTIISPCMLSLPLPMFVFLWGSLTTLRPTTTFWTVLIAYTQVMVVIKALFQNTIFPWNKSYRKYPPSYLNPAAFVGIQNFNQFILSDLFLLLMLFLHRYKLKTLGLWHRTRQEETSVPEDLRVYRMLSSESDFQEVKERRNALNQKKSLADTVWGKLSVSNTLRIALWKRTSKATGTFILRGDNIKTRVRVKEIEGLILVTHDGRRLQPTQVSISQLSEDNLSGYVVLRVYFNDIMSDTKYLTQRLSWAQHFTAPRKFFLQILNREWRVSSDFYTLMFIFQFLNFLIVFFGFSSFTNPVEIQSEDYFNIIDNQVPPMYLFTIVCHFLVIIIDRVFYLRKYILGKLILHVILVILIHAWTFIITPIVTESPLSYLYVPQTYYIFSCFYFLMSAFQLRVGYPMRVQGHFLCKKYNYFNYYAYKGLQFIPFFNQLRILLDYLCIQSSFTMTEWIKMESIFQLVFENKCCRRADIFYPSERGKECPSYSKYCPGIFSVLALFIVIWLPFLVFALFNTVAEPNLPQQGHLELSIENSGEIFKTTTNYNNIISLTDVQYKMLQSIFKNVKKLWSLFSVYDHRDIGVLKFRNEPVVEWSITPPEYAKLKEKVQDTEKPITLYLTWTIRRTPKSQVVARSIGTHEITLTKNHPARQELAEAFSQTELPVHLNNILPKFIHVTNDGKANPVAGFFTPQTERFKNVTLTLMEEDSKTWWKLEEVVDKHDDINLIAFDIHREIEIYTFNEKSTPKLLLNVRRRGILGLYLSMVFVTWTFIRRLMYKYPQIMYENMPNPDPVLQLCHDIYLARESQEFALEEDLFAKLLFLFRSPETLIKFTRLNSEP